MDTRVMLHLDLRHTVPTPVRHYRHKTMELTIQLHVAVFDHFTPVSFEAIIDVVQVYTGHFADHAIKDAGRERFRDGVKTRKFPTRNQVISFIEFRQEIWNLFRVVLQVTVHSKNDLTAAATESGYQRRRFAEVLAEANYTHNARMFGVQFFQFQKGFIGTAIINKYDLIALTKRTKLR